MIRAVGLALAIVLIDVPICALVAYALFQHKGLQRSLSIASGVLGPRASPEIVLPVFFLLFCLVVGGSTAWLGNQVLVWLKL